MLDPAQDERRHSEVIDALYAIQHDLAELNGYVWNVDKSIGRLVEVIKSQQSI